ncbi:MAG: hypothetical protein ONB48_12715 [candidate division KSB1 bacterium]|nr:hypothetical protein [candidate division KSB1 bacterium]MDZ7275043.1 hypothetical protein [candidate division KSB1 bacterium]MDZ7286509.1 hypothetical protein [candidate division KSB1 bacterium]MDZ7299327.1 hypothetical protein [candidate division KSB1 bacterium]MDZ7306999.1 hypothetical protein [candidate division KSB1 bacterium]
MSDTRSGLFFELACRARAWRSEIQIATLNECKVRLFADAVSFFLPRKHPREMLFPWEFAFAEGFFVLDLKLGAPKPAFIPKQV